MLDIQKRFILVDANSLIHRAYHAYPSHLTTSKGEQVNAVYGFSVILLKIVEDLSPDLIICAFDVEKKPTFRNKIYKGYKLTRKPVERELVEQIPIVKEVLKAFDIPILEVEGYEADDLIGTLEAKKDVKEFEKVIVTGDQDMFQLVDRDTKVFLSGRNFRDSKMYGVNEVQKKIGINPSQIVDFKAIYGDPSDNIPGVKGIGKKGAVDLLSKYKSLDEVYKNLDNIDKRYRERLKRHKKEALISYKLAKIKIDADIRYSLKKCRWNELNISKIEKVFYKLEFKSLLGRLVNLSRNEGIKIIKDEVKQQLKFTIRQVKSEVDMEVLRNDAKESKLLCVYIESSDSGVFYLKPSRIIIAIKNTLYDINADSCFNEKSNSPVGLIIKDILENKSIKKIGYDLKNLMHIFYNYDIKLQGLFFDLKLAAYLLRTEKGKTSLADIAFTYIGQVFDSQLNFGSGSSNPDDSMQRAQVVCKLYKILSHRLDKFEGEGKWNLKRLFYDIEMPLIKVLFRMERNGISVDTQYLQNFQIKLEKEIRSLERSAFKYVGHEFNLCSPKQVSDVLFEELDLPKTIRNKSGSYSTSSDQLEKIKSIHPVIEIILQYRELSKLRSTYTLALIKSVDEKTKKIHTTYNQAIAATGRLTSSEPNLQNIPIATELGREVRKAFVCKKGSSFISFDIAQQELRILAHLAGEDSLINAFQRGIDIHALTAGKIFDKDISDVTSQERRIGKTINFGVMYGMSERGLSQSLGITYKQAEDFIIKYFEEYSRVRTFFDAYIKKAEKNGYAETLFGRRKLVGNLEKMNAFARQSVIRELINFPIQGTAADMMKLAMIKVSKVIDRKYKEKAKIIMQIHDELVFEFEGKYMIKELKNDIRRTIEGVYPLKAPLKVEVKEGKSLNDIH